jgi:hypothetical protein
VYEATEFKTRPSAILTSLSMWDAPISYEVVEFSMWDPPISHPHPSLSLYAWDPLLFFFLSHTRGSGWRRCSGGGAGRGCRRWDGGFEARCRVAILQGKEERGGWIGTQQGRRWRWNDSALSLAGDDSGDRRGSDRRRGGELAGVRKRRETATMAPHPLPTPPPRSPWLSSHCCSSPASPAILACAPAPRAPPLCFPSGLEPPLPLLSCTHRSHRRWQRKRRAGARGGGDRGSTGWCGVG